jgi:hypothetical protein
MGRPVSGRPMKRLTRTKRGGFSSLPAAGFRRHGLQAELCKHLEPSYRSCPEHCIGRKANFCAQVPLHPEKDEAGLRFVCRKPRVRVYFFGGALASITVTPNSVTAGEGL